jgi:hypothetical protein
MLFVAVMIIVYATGWRFNGVGKPVSIPQAAVDGDQVAARALSSKRACVAAYPVKVWHVTSFFALLQKSANFSEVVDV